MLIITRTQMVLLAPDDIREGTARALVASGQACRVVGLRIFRDTQYEDDNFKVWCAAGKQNVPGELGEVYAKLLLLHRPNDVEPIADRLFHFNFSECN